MTRTPTLERLTRASEEREDGCIVFTGYVDKQGYGRISHGEKREKQLVHRVAYELHIGPIPGRYADRSPLLHAALREPRAS